MRKVYFWQCQTLNSFCFQGLHPLDPQRGSAPVPRWGCQPPPDPSFVWGPSAPIAVYFQNITVYFKSYWQPWTTVKELSAALVTMLGEQRRLLRNWGMFKAYFVIAFLGRKAHNSEIRFFTLHFLSRIGICLSDLFGIYTFSIISWVK